MKLKYILGVMLALVLLAAAPGFIPAQQHASITVSITVSHVVTLVWNASTGPNVVGYHVQRGTVSGGPYQIIATTTALTFKDTGVSPGATYYYVVTAVDGSNSDSIFSNQVVGTIPNP